MEKHKFLSSWKDRTDNTGHVASDDAHGLSSWKDRTDKTGHVVSDDAHGPATQVLIVWESPDR